MPQGVREVIPAQTEYQFEVLDKLAGESGPNFVFAHVLLPHPPYAFNADGSRVTDAQRASRTQDEQYLEQLKFANAEVLALVDRLHAGPPAEWPVIVVAADEDHSRRGTPRTRNGSSGSMPRRRSSSEKFSILTAISVPGADLAALEAGRLHR